MVSCSGFCGDVSGSVGGGIVDEDKLPFGAEGEAGFGLTDKGGDAGLGGDCSSLRAGMMTESSNWSGGGGFERGSQVGSFTTSYYRKWRVLCVDCGLVQCWVCCW